MTDTPCECATSQRDLYRPEKKVGKNFRNNFMELSKGKCQVLHLERKNSVPQYRLRAEQLENSSTEEILGVHEPALVPLQQRRSTVSWFALGVVLPAG